MEVQQLLVGIAVLGFTFSGLYHTAEGQSISDQLGNSPPAANASSNSTTQTASKRMWGWGPWGDYGMGDGMRGLLWGLTLSGHLPSAAAAAPAPAPAAVSPAAPSPVLPEVLLLLSETQFRRRREAPDVGGALL
ncbi:hypothetical protein RvY_12248 [Ramazzottius varieornatus]|uniref:Uncharacterized protein n=1 Tax=Ramazzottius varieornatus TaxID=947166 RepID=A0A1D1VIV3_RAMVA|nr:hypothetical protein RvY_12248 [Ramazzottius varieornatus]